MMKVLIALAFFAVPFSAIADGAHWTAVKTTITGVYQYQNQMPGDTGPVVTTLEVTYRSCAVFTKAQFNINATLAEGGEGFPVLSANVLQLEDGCLNPVTRDIEIESLSVPLFRKVTVYGDGGKATTLDVENLVVD